MDGPRDDHIMLSEVSWTEKDKYLWYCLYVGSEKKKMQMNFLFIVTNEGREEEG